MDDTADTATAEPGQAQNAEGQVDWKAMARKHEDREKALAAKVAELKKKADLYDEQTEAGRSDLEKALARAEKAEKGLADARQALAEKDRMVLAAQVAAAKGVPADRIRGDSREEMEADADELLALIRPTVAGGRAADSPFVPGAGSEAPDSPATSAEEARAAARKYLGIDKSTNR